MKKLLSLALALLLAACCLPFLFSCKKEEKKLILGFDATYPPYGYLDEATGKYVGFDLEYAQKVCNNLGYKLELLPIEWASKDEQLKTGAIDFIWNGFTYEGREEAYEWSDRYLNNSIVVLVKSDSGISALSDLAGKIVTVQSKSSGETALSEKSDLVASFKNGKYELDADYTAAFNRLSAGAVEAIVVDVGVAEYLIRDKAGYKILNEQISTETYGVGFLKGNTALRDEINAEMKKIATENPDFIKGLCKKYGVSYDAFTLGK